MLALLQRVMKPAIKPMKPLVPIVIEMPNTLGKPTNRSSNECHWQSDHQTHKRILGMRPVTVQRLSVFVTHKQRINPHVYHDVDNKQINRTDDDDDEIGGNEVIKKRCLVATANHQAAAMAPKSIETAWLSSPLRPWLFRWFSFTIGQIGKPHFRHRPP